MSSVAGKFAEPVHYKLYGVLYHHGESAGTGHYTVDVLHPNGDNGDREAWLHIDDETVGAVRHGAMIMSRWTTGVLICCFIVALLLLRHDLFNFFQILLSSMTAILIQVKNVECFKKNKQETLFDSDHCDSEAGDPTCACARFSWGWRSLSGRARA
jgi:hypothetical protein